MFQDVPKCEITGRWIDCVSGCANVRSLGDMLTVFQEVSNVRSLGDGLTVFQDVPDVRSLGDGLTVFQDVPDVRSLGDMLTVFQDVPNVLVGNCGPRFFSVPLPGSILLILDFINAAGTIISAVDYKEVSIAG